MLGAAWGGLFGLLIFRRRSMFKFSALYGAGFGIGMCAPQVRSLTRDFLEVRVTDKTTPKGDREFYDEIDDL